MRLIDADAVTKRLEAIKEAFKAIHEIDVYHGFVIAEAVVEESPTIEPKRGRWEVKGQDIYCSRCGNESAYNPFGASKFSLYCPNCGAIMEASDD